MKRRKENSVSKKGGGGREEIGGVNKGEKCSCVLVKTKGQSDFYLTKTVARIALARKR